MSSTEQDIPNEDETDTGKRFKRMRESAAQLKKAPQAPKRFKSSYICFFMAKRPEIKQQLGAQASMTEISKRSAVMWKDLPAEERQHWENLAAKDKERYMNEKASYTGPWQVPSKRAKKDPSAPKRPMSAFLYYALGKRTELKKKHPDMINTNVSRLLGEMWRAASAAERKPFVDKEKAEREKYKAAMEKWKKEKEEKEKHRLRQEVAASSYWQAFYNPNTATEEPDSPFATTENMYMPGPNGYPPYPYAPQPYMLPTIRKQPVILGANGMPIMPYAGPPAGAAMPLQQVPGSVERTYPPAATLPGPAPYDTTENFEFPPEQEHMSPETTTAQ